ncbi:hypothetical protein BB560_005686 [Smittium megazygosporum]|uniref:tRNA(Ile)-lysidine synthetase n=1 Tax=Smittium megazygosporum TaxID=133381 RepID=A0A2T9Z1E0_9FUNG|nr:hypothetical protein BB560_005686 [Smittium megazygosporum]
MTLSSFSKSSISKFNSIVSLFDKSQTSYALAVSGGVDSMALAFLSKKSSISSRCYPIIVDHSLREESSAEALQVSKNLLEFGFKPQTIKIQWLDKVSTTDSRVVPLMHERDTLYEKNNIYYYFSQYLKPGNDSRLEKLARSERYRAIELLCMKKAISYIITGHHKDDLCETFIMRLSRQSGIFGLSGMDIFSPYPIISSSFSKSISLFRPLLLDFDKSALLKLCTQNNIPWVEDSSNSDLTFVRNSLRNLKLSAKENSENLAIVSENTFPIVYSLKRQLFGFKSTIDTILAEIASFNNATGESRWNLSSKKVVDILKNNQTILHSCLSRTIQWVSCSDYPSKLSDIQSLSKSIFSLDKSTPNSTCVSGVFVIKPNKKRPFLLFCKQVPPKASFSNLDFFDIPVGKEILWNGSNFIHVSCNVPSNSNCRFSVISVARALFLLKAFNFNAFSKENSSVKLKLADLSSSKFDSQNFKILLSLFKKSILPNLSKTRNICTEFSVLFQPVIVIYKSTESSSIIEDAVSFIPSLGLYPAQNCNFQISITHKA